jgi:prophage regulatory protein
MRNHVQHTPKEALLTSILRLPTVKARTGLSRSTIYLRIAEGSFPRPVSLGARAVGWVEAEVNGWLPNVSKPAARRGGDAMAMHTVTHFNLTRFETGKTGETNTVSNNEYRGSAARRLVATDA